MPLNIDDIEAGFDIDTVASLSALNTAPKERNNKVIKEFKKFFTLRVRRLI